MEELSTREIAELLGVNIRTVQRYLNGRKIFAYRIGGRWKTTRLGAVYAEINEDEEENE